MKIGYLAHNLNDPSIERRCIMLERGGAQLVLAGFCRDEALAPAIASRDAHVIGRTRDAALFARIGATMQARFADAALRRLFDGCDVVMARNLEQLAIAEGLVGDRPLIYECLDIHRLLTGSGLAAHIVRLLEGRLLRRVDLLLTSSPAFITRHFDDRPLDAPVRLVENKVLIGEGERPPARVPKTPATPMTIGWFGMLRCRRTFAFLSQLVAASKGRIEVLVAGKPSSAELPDFEARIAALPGMRFVGPYRYADLPRLYAQCHLAWTIDWFEEGLNSAWLLPNRLYEALAHGVVPVALADIEVGRWLSRHDAGLRVDRPQAARERLLAMESAELRDLQARVLQIDASDILADTPDCRDLVAAIAGAARR